MFRIYRNIADKTDIKAIFREKKEGLLAVVFSANGDLYDSGNTASLYEKFRKMGTLNTLTNSDRTLLNEGNI